MPRLTDLYEVQLGTETSTDSWGTDVTPTVKLMGITDVNISPIVSSQMFEELRNSLAPGFESELIEVGANASLDGVLSYEDAPYLLQAAFGDPGTSENSGDSDFTDRSYEAPLGTYDSDVSAGGPVIYTLVYGGGGSDSDAYQMQGATLESMSITGETGGPISFTSSWIGKQADTDALATLSDRDVNVVMGDHFELYIDASGGTVGNTQIQNLAFSFDVSVNTNRALLYHLDNLTPDNFRDSRFTGQLSLSLELDGTSVAYLNDILDRTGPVKKLIRINATSGTNVFRIDFHGTILGAPEVHTDNDGVSTVDLTFEGEYSSGFGNWLKASVTNSLTSLA